MSLYSALFAGVSGLGAQASAMAGVADNITNINTVGYKGVSMEFRTLVGDSSGKAGYAAGGVIASPQSMVSKQGLLQASSSSTDLGIDGGGFFVTRDGPESDAGVQFTRAGSFKPDSQGYLRNASGYYLQGWKLDSQGSYTNTGSVAGLQSIRLSELTGTALPTTKIALRANLQSTAPTVTYATGDIAAGNVTPAFTRAIDVYDAQGGAHRLTLGFVRTGANQWSAEVYAEDPAEATTTGLPANFTVRFNDNGSLDLGGSTLPTALNVDWANGAGSEPIRLMMGSDDGLDGLTQSADESGLISKSVDGGLVGNVASIGISEEGVVSAFFDDGSSRAIYQLPLATFQNPDALTRLQGNAFTTSGDSGGVLIDRPGALGAGTISAGTLEASNVDLAQEFTNMIRFQRAYSASSKIITTVDDMLQEVSNLKR